MKLQQISVLFSLVLLILCFLVDVESTFILAKPKISLMNNGSNLGSSVLHRSVKKMKMEYLNEVLKGNYFVLSSSYSDLFAIDLDNPYCFSETKEKVLSISKETGSTGVYYKLTVLKSMERMEECMIEGVVNYDKTGHFPKATLTISSSFSDIFSLNLSQSLVEGSFSIEMTKRPVLSGYENSKVNDVTKERSDTGETNDLESDNNVHVLGNYGTGSRVTSFPIEVKYKMNITLSDPSNFIGRYVKVRPHSRGPFQLGITTFPITTPILEKGFPYEVSDCTTFDGSGKVVDIGKAGYFADNDEITFQFIPNSLTEMNSIECVFTIKQASYAPKLRHFDLVKYDDTFHSKYLKLVDISENPAVFDDPATAKLSVIGNNLFTMIKFYAFGPVSHFHRTSCVEISANRHVTPITDFKLFFQYDEDFESLFQLSSTSIVIHNNSKKIIVGGKFFVATGFAPISWRTCEIDYSDFVTTTKLLPNSRPFLNFQMPDFTNIPDATISIKNTKYLNNNNLLTINFANINFIDFKNLEITTPFVASFDTASVECFMNNNPNDVLPALIQAVVANVFSITFHAHRDEYISDTVCLLYSVVERLEEADFTAIAATPIKMNFIPVVDGVTIEYTDNLPNPSGINNFYNIDNPNAQSLETLSKETTSEIVVDSDGVNTLSIDGVEGNEDSENEVPPPIMANSNPHNTAVEVTLLNAIRRTFTFSIHHYYLVAKSLSDFGIKSLGSVDTSNLLGFTVQMELNKMLVRDCYSSVGFVIDISDRRTVLDLVIAGVPNISAGDAGVIIPDFTLTCTLGTDMYLYPMLPHEHPYIRKDFYFPDYVPDFTHMIYAPVGLPAESVDLILNAPIKFNLADEAGSASLSVIWVDNPAYTFNTIRSVKIVSSNGPIPASKQIIGDYDDIEHLLSNSQDTAGLRDNVEFKFGSVKATLTSNEQINRIDVIFKSPSIFRYVTQIQVHFDSDFSTTDYDSKEYTYNPELNRITISFTKQSNNHLYSGMGKLEVMIITPVNLMDVDFEFHSQMNYYINSGSVSGLMTVLELPPVLSYSKSYITLHGISVADNIDICQKTLLLSDPTQNTSNINNLMLSPDTCSAQTSMNLEPIIYPYFDEYTFTIPLSPFVFVRDHKVLMLIKDQSTLSYESFYYDSTSEDYIRQTTSYALLGYYIDNLVPKYKLRFFGVFYKTNIGLVIDVSDLPLVLDRCIDPKSLDVIEVSPLMSETGATDDETHVNKFHFPLLDTRSQVAQISKQYYEVECYFNNVSSSSSSKSYTGVFKTEMIVYNSPSDAALNKDINVSSLSTNKKTLSDLENTEVVTSLFSNYIVLSSKKIQVVTTVTDTKSTGLSPSELEDILNRYKDSLKNVTGGVGEDNVGVGFVDTYPKEDLFDTDIVISIDDHIDDTIGLDLDIIETVNDGFKRNITDSIKSGEFKWTSISTLPPTYVFVASHCSVDRKCGADCKSLCAVGSMCESDSDCLLSECIKGVCVKKTIDGDGDKEGEEDKDNQAYSIRGTNSYMVLFLSLLPIICYIATYF